MGSQLIFPKVIHSPRHTFCYMLYILFYWAILEIGSFLNQMLGYHMKGYVNKVGRYKMGTNIHEVVDISIFF